MTEQTDAYNDITDKDILQDSIKRGNIKTLLYRYVNKKRLAVFGIIVCAILYVGYLLFGSNSLQVLLDLSLQKSKLSKEVEKLESQNAELKKKIFEIRGLVP